MNRYNADSIFKRLRALAERDPFVFDSSAIPARFRRAAVLIAFWREEDGCVRTLLTKRAAHLSTHPGQVSFPGGIIEAGESIFEAALREAHEEVGLVPSSVEVMGRLDDAWSGTGSHLVPVVGWLGAAPSLEANPDEVAALLRPRVPDLMLESARRQEIVEHRGVDYVNQIVDWPGGRAYGLTADLLIEALDWAGGGEPARGPVRLAELRSHPISRE